MKLTASLKVSLATIGSWMMLSSKKLDAGGVIMKVLMFCVSWRTVPKEKPLHVYFATQCKVATSFMTSS